MRSQSSGKGHDRPLRPRPSAMCRGHRTGTRGIHQGRRAPDPGQLRSARCRTRSTRMPCQLYSERQYALPARDQQGLARFRVRQRSARSHPGRSIGSPVWSLTEQRSKYLPTAFLFYGFPMPDGPGGTPGPIPMATPPAPASRTPSCRGSSSWSSGNRSPTGSGTTGRPGRPSILAPSATAGIEPVP